MPAGDPAGYLPNVRRARKRSGQPEYQPRSKQSPPSRPRNVPSPGQGDNAKFSPMTQSTPGGGSSKPRPQFQHDPHMQRPRPKGQPRGGTVTFPGRAKAARAPQTHSTPGGSYDGHPAEDDPRFNPRRDGNKRGGYRGRRRRSRRPLGIDSPTNEQNT